MKVSLIQIGNSKGVRIPRAVIRECGLGDEIEMRVERGAVVLAPVRGTRAGWGDAFLRMAADGDDAQLVPDTLDHPWDAEEWAW